MNRICGTGQFGEMLWESYETTIAGSNWMVTAVNGCGIVRHMTRLDVIKFFMERAPETYIIECDMNGLRHSLVFPHQHVPHSQAEWIEEQLNA